MEKLKFLDNNKVRLIAGKFGSPVFVYDEVSLLKSASEALSFPNAYGITVRFSMKSLPDKTILKLLHTRGLEIDASSGFEAQRAILAGIPPQHIQITAQEFPSDLKYLIEKGVKFVACSLNQIEQYGKLFPNTSPGVRINPGLGSGHSNRCNVGGPSSSFGIWYEYIPEVQKILKKYHLTLKTLHTHIGSGSDPLIWKKVALMSLKLVETFPSVEILNLGGGFKVGRMSYEKSTNMRQCGLPVKKAFIDFFKKTGRKLHLEIEPGTFLTAKNGSIIARIMDIVNTGKTGFNFIKLNTGMTEVARPTLYGAQHPIIHVPLSPKNDNKKTQKLYMVSGHCCESGDILTPKPGCPEELAPRKFPVPEINDLMVIEGSGSYCASMCTKNYNSFPEAAEILITKNGNLKLIRKRQSMEQMVQNEL